MTLNSHGGDCSQGHDSITTTLSNGEPNSCHNESILSNSKCQF